MPVFFWFQGVRVGFLYAGLWDRDWLVPWELFQFTGDSFQWLPSFFAVCVSVFLDELVNACCIQQGM